MYVFKKIIIKTNENTTAFDFNVMVIYIYLDGCDNNPMVRLDETHLYHLDGETGRRS